MDRAQAGSVDRDREVARTLWLVLGLNLLTAGAKLGVGAWIGSLALLADGLHALLDASSNVVGLVGTWIGMRPPDAGHPYGHRRFQTMAAVVIGLLITGGIIGIVDALVRAIVDERPAPSIDLLAVAAIAATVILALGVSRYERGKARELDSAILAADAAHTMSDALGAIVVLASFAGTWLGLRWADVAAGAIVCLLIARTAWSVLATNVEALADAAQLDPREVHRVATSVAGVLGAHKVRSRGAADHVQLDLHIQLDPKTPLEEAHAKTHEVAAALRSAFPSVRDVLIHTEPERSTPEV